MGHIWRENTGYGDWGNTAKIRRMKKKVLKNKKPISKSYGRKTLKNITNGNTIVLISVLFQIFLGILTILSPLMNLNYKF